uniref:MARVEL domain-containing protein n=1 Tax=Caenorhabditis japonica TaxID=281687 RepID=A0A8R1DEN5_CAEJA
MAIRMLPYSAIECIGSMLVLILSIISMTIAISSEEFTNDIGFLVTAVLCFLIALIHFVNLVIHIRRWNNGHHHLNPPGVYEYTNYGSER